MKLTTRYDKLRDDYGVRLYEQGGGDPSDLIDRICELERMVLSAYEDGTFFPTGELEEDFQVEAEEIMDRMDEVEFPLGTEENDG